MPDPFFITRRKQLVALAACHAMPAIYPLRIFADLGGLMSYGGGLVELLYQQAGIYVGDSQRRHESPLIGGQPEAAFRGRPDRF
jgi:hypothetical protein